MDRFNSGVTCQSLSASLSPGRQVLVSSALIAVLFCVDEAEVPGQGAELGERMPESQTLWLRDNLCSRCEAAPCRGAVPAAGGAPPTPPGSLGKIGRSLSGLGRQREHLEASPGLSLWTEPHSGLWEALT